MKTYKMISVNYTEGCIKKPRCSFCYLIREKTFTELKRDADKSLDYFDLNNLEHIFADAEQVAIAYNGVDIRRLIDIVRFIRDCKPKPLIHITTNPCFISRPYLKLFHNLGIMMIALSLDPEKCSLKKWISIAKIAKQEKLKVGANILMLDGMYKEISGTLKQITSHCNQIYLLRPKFYEQKIPLQKRKEIIYLLRQRYWKLFIDECFQNEFQNIPCRRGKDFISINADGSTSLCSFDIFRDNIKDVKKCPYI